MLSVCVMLIVDIFAVLASGLCAARGPSCGDSHSAERAPSMTGISDSDARAFVARWQVPRATKAVALLACLNFVAAKSLAIR